MPQGDEDKIMNSLCKRLPIAKAKYAVAHYIKK